MITATILAVTSAIIIVMSNSQFQQKIREESLAANGIEPENAALPTTNIGENTASTNQTFWVNTVHLDGNANINGDLKLMHPTEKFPKFTTSCWMRICVDTT